MEGVVILNKPTYIKCIEKKMVSSLNLILKMTYDKVKWSFL
jgi:hypothetical protein